MPPGGPRRLLTRRCIASVLAFGELLFEGDEGFGGGGHGSGSRPEIAPNATHNATRGRSRAIERQETGGFILVDA